MIRKMRRQQGVVSLLTRRFHGFLKRLMRMRPGPPLRAVHLKIGIPRQQYRHAVTTIEGNRTVRDFEGSAFVQHPHLGFIVEVDGVFVRCKLSVAILRRMAMPQLSVILSREDFAALQGTHSCNTVSV